MGNTKQLNKVVCVQKSYLLEPVGWDEGPSTFGDLLTATRMVVRCEMDIYFIKHCRLFVCEHGQTFARFSIPRLWQIYQLTKLMSFFNEVIIKN